MQFPNWLHQRAVSSKEAIALIYKDFNKDTHSGASQCWNYAQLAAEVEAWVDYLQELGIKSGDRVGLLLSNHPRYLMVVHALIRCEAIAVFLNIRLTSTELEWQLIDSQTDYLLFDQANQTTTDLISIPNKINIDNVEKNFENLEVKVNTTSNFHQIIHQIDSEKIQGIFYTSGTTGKPKAVPLTYSNHFHSAIASSLHLGIYPQDNWLLCMPLFHVGGLAIAWRSVINGTAITLLPKFDEQNVLEAIATQKVTIISLVPTMLQRLLQHPLWQNLQKLRAILLGGAPATPELVTQCLNLNLPIMTTYGMTETASQITTLSPQDIHRKQGSAGLPLFGNQIRIVDLEDTTQDLTIGQVGQILVKGASVMSGYLGQNSPQNGWFATGDLGYCDRDGYLYVVNRRADLIISGGENIYPSEIEAILSKHPAIAEVCVLGIGDREWGEAVAVVVVSNHLENLSLGNLSLESIREFCVQQNLARYKLPKYLYIWKSLPKTASGKIMRQRIRESLSQ